LDWGDKIDFLKQIKKDTGETPQALLNQPKPSRFEQPIFDAFQMLSGSRNWAAGFPASIPLSEILSYFYAFGIYDEDERYEYVIIIQRLDAKYLEYFRRKIK
jgi:hypothetical protein